MLSRSKFLEILAKNIKNARIDAGLSQEELSAKCGFYRTKIGLIETGNRMPTAYTLHRIVKELNVPITNLYPKLG